MGTGNGHQSSAYATRNVRALDFGSALLDAQGTCSPALSESGSKKADYLHATADSEKENLLKLGYNTQIEVIPNGIEVENIVLKKDWERKNEFCSYQEST